MRSRGVQLCVWSRGYSLNGSRPVPVHVVRFYSDVPNPKPPEGHSTRGAEAVKEKALEALQNVAALGRQWAQSTSRTARSTLNYWWSRYEEFVGINEVREAQTKVTQAESDFMVSRSLVRDGHVNLEALQGRLKEVRERLDRVTREEPRYLELATIEHKLLQEDRRLRSTYELAEGSEREKFALFSAAVRESHEKERTRAERTKNWSIFGSVLGAIIGVMGSTYVNRVRLQELKSLLLEAQKGPESLQEALRVQASNHRSQQDELESLIDQMRLTLHTVPSSKTTAPPHIAASYVAIDPTPALTSLHEGQKNTHNILQGLKLGLNEIHDDVVMVQKLLDQNKSVVKAERSRRVDVKEVQTLNEEVLVKRLEETQRSVCDRIRTTVAYNAVMVYTASAICASVLYLLMRGPSP